MAAKKTTKARKCSKSKGCAKAKKKTVTKAKKTAKTTKTAKIAKVSKARTKSEIVNALVDLTELTRKDVNGVFEALGEVMGHDLGKKGPGVFMLPGLMKVRVVKKPATKARKGTNPFTGEAMTFKAKPARNVVRIRPLSNLKSMV